MVQIDHDLQKQIAHMAGVKDKIHNEGRKLASKAEAALAPHHLTGRGADTHIELDNHGVDSEVSLVGPNAIAFEFGHDNVLTGKFTPGQYVLTTAADVLKSGWGK